eukprot:GHVP01025357.1.p2 GENE.GHVP01025357.1~~GHVP01025357.1.p2  ORF type:complete len:119 (+),score=12.65 GHVP01025357.1:1159-1515(+)
MFPNVLMFELFDKTNAAHTESEVWNANYDIKVNIFGFYSPHRELEQKMPVLGEEEITVFRTKACRRHSTPKANLPTPIDKFPPSCRFGQNCYFSHNAQWLRRIPFLLTTPQTSLRKHL